MKIITITMIMITILQLITIMIRFLIIFNI